MPRFPIAFILAAALAVLSACTPGPPGAPGPTSRLQSDFIATNGFLVAPGPAAGQFTVLARAGAGGQDFFCAAGDYAWVRLNARQVDRVVLVGPAAPDPAFNGQRSAIFTVTSREFAPQGSSIFIRMRRAGENLTVAHSVQLCRTAAFNGILN